MRISYRLVMLKVYTEKEVTKVKVKIRPKPNSRRGSGG